MLSKYNLLVLVSFKEYKTSTAGEFVYYSGQLFRFFPSLFFSLPVLFEHTGQPVKPHMNNSIARVGLCQMLTQMKLLCHHCRGGPCTADATGVLSGSSSNVYCEAFFVTL